MSDDWEGGNDDVWSLWGGIILLFLVGTAIHVFGWKLVVLTVFLIVTIPVVVHAYLVSETHRYRKARRDIRLLTKWTLRRMKDLER